MARLTGLSRSIPAHEGIPLALLESQLGASKDLDAFASSLALALANRLLAGSDSDGDAFNVELDVFLLSIQTGE